MPADALLAARPALPFIAADGTTVTQIGGAVYINRQRCNAVDALDLSAAIARAVREAAEHRITNQTTTARH